MATIGNSSETYNWFLDNGGIVTEAFERCGIHSTALTRNHFISATRSLNLELQDWSNRGVNLFQIELQSIPLNQGQPTYTLPQNLVNIIDAYLEAYTLNTTVNQAPAFTTTLGSSVVTVNQPGHDMVTNNWIDIVVPVAVGGIVVSGLYQITFIDDNNYTINVADKATAPASLTGVVPQFTSVQNSSTITYGLTNHGLTAMTDFNIGVSTLVGGIPLFGSYTVGAVVDANTFTFTAQYQASAADVEFENSGEVQFQTQANSADPIDTIMTSISRTDYASQPNKLSQAKPTTFWFDRLSPTPDVTLWNVPDGNGPYAFFYYGMRRIQDANIGSGETPDVPYRFLEALCAGLARRLARKWAPPLVEDLTKEAAVAWTTASGEDRERVQFFLVPDTSGYFQ